MAQAQGFSLNVRSLANKVRLAVVCGSFEHAPSGLTIHKRDFSSFGLEYVSAGQGEVKLNGCAHPVHPGTIFCHGPEMVQDITVCASQPLARYFVEFVGSGAEGLLRSCKLSPGDVSQVFPPHVLEGLFDELIESGQQQGLHSPKLCVQLLKCLALKIAGARGLVAGSESLAFATYENCRQHIAQHYPRLRNLEQISAECHLTSAHLCRLFHRYDRQTPYQYLLRLKMHAAAQRLAHPGTLVKEAAEEVGFADAFHFSRLFKTVLGLSPAAFRRLQGHRAHGQNGGR